MSRNTNLVFKALEIIAWVIFVGLAIEAAALIVNFFFSILKPEVVGKLYQKLDLGYLYDYSKFAFFGMYSYIIVIAVLKTVLFYIVIMLITKLDLAKPFNSFVAGRIKIISYYTLIIGLAILIARASAKHLEHHGVNTDVLNQFLTDGQGFILMAAVVYVISAIFSRGVELQHENDLTV